MLPGIRIPEITREKLIADGSAAKALEEVNRVMKETYVLEECDFYVEYIECLKFMRLVVKMPDRRDPGKMIVQSFIASSCEPLFNI
jgi:hypothetical protein